MSAGVIKVELSTGSIDAISQIATNIANSFREIIEPIKEIKNILSDAFTPDPLRDFISAMADVVTIITRSRSFDSCRDSRDNKSTFCSNYSRCRLGSCSYHSELGVNCRIFRWAMGGH